jgi:NADPH-dependent ferric siderophore reductase
MSVAQSPARGVRGRLLDRMFVRGRVEDARSAPGRMRWIGIGGVPGLDWTPGQHVRVHMADLTSARTWVSGKVRDALRPAPYHLSAGGETASVTFGAMLRAAGPGEPVYGAVEVAEPEDRLPLPRGEVLTWCRRGGASAASSEILVDAVCRLDLPDEPGFAYVAGEARTVQAVRAHLVRERGWPRRSVQVKPYWTPSRRGMD